MRRPFPGENGDVARWGQSVAVILICWWSPDYKGSPRCKTTRWARPAGGVTSASGLRALGGVPEGDPAEGRPGRLERVVALGLELLADGATARQRDHAVEPDPAVGLPFDAEPG